jgi:3,4-dihydroxy 2-butanone 4-phosphate synthase/GTP cyclohydrolase II
MIHFDSVESAIAELREGKLVLVIDDDDRENEGDLIGSASLASAEMINFMVTEARGAFIAVFMPYGLCDRLGIPKMIKNNGSFNETQFRVSVDAFNGGSGSSVTDRALTAKLLADPDSSPEMFVRPGHVIPIEAHPLGL